MRRSALTPSLLAVGLAALACGGCDQLKTPLDTTPPPPPKCASTTDANGQICTTCWDLSTGKMISNACVSPPTGSDAVTGGDVCTTIMDGGPGSCAPYASWKQSAVDRCATQNLQLTGITPGPSCDGGNYQSISYTCCPGATTSPPPPPKCAETTDATGQVCKTCWDPVSGAVISNDCVPGSTGSGGSGGGSMCTTIDDGGPTSCKPYDLWKQYGADRCAQQNLQLTDLTPGPSCDDGYYQSVTYTCCASTSPPPPIKCGETTDASGQTCKTCWDPSGMIVSNDCVPAPTGSGGASGTGMCTTIVDGGATSCKPTDLWKQYGTERCAQQNLQLADLALGASCGGDSYQSVTYTCCATTTTTTSPPPPGSTGAGGAGI